MGGGNEIEWGEPMKFMGVGHMKLMGGLINGWGRGYENDGGGAMKLIKGGL